VYEPSALVRHRHEYAQLRVQITDFGVGFYAYLVRSAIAYPRQQFAIASFGLWWLWRRNIRRLLLSLMHPWPVARALILTEMRGSLIGLGRYQQALPAAAVIARAFGPIAPVAPLDVACAGVVSTRTSAPLNATQAPDSDVPGGRRLPHHTMRARCRSWCPALR
jgi:O-antigen biosynthesis protein